ncbi:MAG: M23 family metallopeptidase [Candidatus Komeilibacteria bacterium]|nr:M23 family metallopeptidase [Candidatus Komeilibacteria bacterium]
MGKNDHPDSRPANFFASYLPLAVMVIIGLTLIGSSLQARGLKPDNYGHDSFLFKNLQSLGQDSAENDFDLEEIEEGPLLNVNSVSYYLAGDSITADEAVSEKKDNSINTLISTTQDESALIAPDITDPEVVVKVRDKIIDYVVQPGDVISTIAAKFGVNVNTLLWENNLTAYTTIRPGQTLKVLPLNGVSHRVKKGDNLNAIAKKYQGDAAKILEFNKIASLDELQIDQVLIIPGGVKQAVIAQPSYTVRNIISPPAPAQISGSKMQWPTSSFRITQYYHLRHSGVDIGNKMGQPIYAAEGGVVEVSGWNSGGYGYYVIINHGNGFKTLYGHASKLYVTKGQQVNRGAVIAAIGSTGRSTGPHLHFEIISTGRKINPLGYIR